MKRYLWLICFMSLGACAVHEAPFTGYWEGPHPVDPDMHFYIRIRADRDSLSGKGYWTRGRFYEAGFGVDSVMVHGDSLAFRIPDWGCRYKGCLSEGTRIRGRFICDGEADDPLELIRRDSMARYLEGGMPGWREAAFLYEAPEERGDGLIVGEPTEAGDSLFIRALLPRIIRGDFGRINSFLVYRHGRLICEEYFFGYRHSDPHPIESCTKSVSSLLVGMAMDRGEIEDVETPLWALLPEHNELRKAPYSDIKLRHLLSMTAGFAPDDAAVFGGTDRIEAALGRIPVAAPGDTFMYDGGSTEILGAVLRAQTGMFADAYAQKYLFEPMGIRCYDWDVHRQQGYPSMGGALALLPRDMVKLGVLVLHEGQFDGKQLLSPEWIEASTSFKTHSHIEGDDYAWQWWRLQLISGRQSYPCIWANGWGGQFIYIVPSLDLVLVSTGHNYEGDSWAITGGIAEALRLLDGQGG